MTVTQSESVVSVLAISCAAHVARTTKRCGAPVRRGKGSLYQIEYKYNKGRGGCELATPNNPSFSRESVVRASI